LALCLYWLLKLVLHPSCSIIIIFVDSDKPDGKGKETKGVTDQLSGKDDVGKENIAEPSITHPGILAGKFQL
jgi:hypothetical protein